MQVETHQTGWKTIGKQDMVPRHIVCFCEYPICPFWSQLGGLRDSPGVTAGERKSAWPLGWSTSSNTCCRMMDLLHVVYGEVQ